MTTIETDHQVSKTLANRKRKGIRDSKNKVLRRLLALDKNTKTKLLQGTLKYKDLKNEGYLLSIKDLEIVDLLKFLNNKKVRLTIEVLE